MNDPWKQERAFLMKAPPRSLEPGVEKALLVEAGRRLLADADALLTVLPFVDHNPHCTIFRNPFRECDCGYQNVIDHLPERLK